MDPDLGDGEAPRASSVGRTNSFLRLAGAPSLLMRSLSMREPRRRGNLAPIPEVDDKKNAARLAEMNKRSKTPDPKTMRNAKAAKSQARFYKDGSEYIGDLSKDGKRHGRGTMYNKDGRMIYDGEWKDDKMEGMGTYFYSDGSKYIGQWRQGKKHGEGTFHFAPRKRKTKLERASTEPGDKTGQDSSTPTLTTSRSAPIKPTESHDDVPESAAPLKADSSTSSVTLPDEMNKQQQQQEDSSGNSRGLPQSKSVSFLGDLMGNAPKWAADAHDIKRSTSLPLSPIKELPASTASSIATSSTAGTRGLPASLAPAEAEPLRVADFVDTEEEEERPRPGSKPRTSAQVLASLRMFQEPPEVPTLRPVKPLSNIPEVPETSMINMMEQDKPEPSGMGGAMQHAAEEQPHEEEANKGVLMYEEEEEAMEEDDYGLEEEEEEDGKKGRRRKGKRGWSLGSLFSRHKKEKKKKDSEAASGPDKDAVKIEEDDGRIVYYKGSLWGHLRHGRGVLKDRAGNVLYDGEWAEDKKHGMGVCFYPDGSMYEGRFRQGVRHGDGTFYFADGGRYQGSWRHDMEDGQGICYLSDGTRYEGEWKEGEMHGRGTLFSTHGSALYRGAWVRGEPAKDLEPEGKEAASAIKEHGEQAVHVLDATKLRSQGQTATAALASHLLSGGAAATEDVRDRALATAAQEEEEAMETVQKERKKKGKGGGLFARLLRRGKRRSAKDEEDEEEAERAAESRGLGEDEDSLEGARSAFAMRPDDVANGEAVGDVGVGRREYEDGSVYEGEMAAGMRHGHGVLRSLDGGVYRGCWRRDREEGAGVYVLPDGTRYEGEWHLGDMHGHGTMINRQGRVLFAGRWADNEPEAEGDASEAGRAARAAADQATSLVRKPTPPAAEEAGRRQHQPQTQPAARPSERGLFGSSSRPISTEESSRPAAAELPRPAVDRVVEAVHEEVRAVEHKVAAEEAAAHEDGDNKPPTGGLLRSLSLRSSSLRGGMGRMLRQISIRAGDDDDDDDEEPVAPQEAPVLPPKNGRGKHTYKDGSFYLGEFRDHKRHGYGKQTYPTGGHYEGQWSEDREDGQGTRFLADGSKYVGKWRKGEMHGQGTLFNSYGRVLYRGDWAGGEPTDMLQ